ncbi:hypothetical protein B0T16DRAFT_418549 [Cercophora newfieldiana]|uniref:Uncharacterized protein n=1 Tax=Cercophora newfieldiana TaxID=92897 RepID=A0AA39XXG9_9PEZI|nr:hypothetical protein B0T16DRAFT_418549 [Cercophora newfieldiana]
MPEPVERGESPPPERSTGKQMHDPPASGKGVDDASHQEEANKKALEVGPFIHRPVQYQADNMPSRTWSPTRRDLWRTKSRGNLQRTPRWIRARSLVELEQIVDVR